MRFPHAIMILEITKPEGGEHYEKRKKYRVLDLVSGRF